MGSSGKRVSLQNQTIFLSLGSNLGNREENLQKAITYLHQELIDIECSQIYETLPLYEKKQPKFLNCVIKGKTDRNPFKLLDYCMNLEIQLGRDRIASRAKGPRIIDIDILLYNNEIIHDHRLHIPHPGMYEREFVLLPLIEIDPNVKDPESGKLFSFYFNRLESQGVSMYEKTGV